VIERLPTTIHGAAVTAGSAPSVVHAPLLTAQWVDDARISSSRTQTALDVPGGGRFWVERGERVVVDAGPEDQPVPWLHSTVGAFVLAQQGRFALHANVVEINGVAIAICGRRGAGKSTTSLALAQAGHRLITDDVATLDFDGRGVVHPPAGRPVHVHTDTAARLGLSIADATPVTGDPGKLALANPAGDPVRVRAIVALGVTTDAGRSMELKPLSPAAGLRATHRQTYRRSVLDQVWQTELFGWAAAVADRVPVWTLSRPADVWTVEVVCVTLEGLPVDPADSG